MNIPGCDVAKGDEVAVYVGAGPPEKTGLHRYIFLGKISITYMHSSKYIGCSRFLYREVVVFFSLVPRPSSPLHILYY